MPHTIEAIFFTDRGLPNDEMEVRGVWHADFLKKHGLRASQVPLLKLHNDRLEARRRRLSPSLCSRDLKRRRFAFGRPVAIAEPAAAEAVAAEPVAAAAVAGAIAPSAAIAGGGHAHRRAGRRAMTGAATRRSGRSPTRASSRDARRATPAGKSPPPPPAVASSPPPAASIPNESPPPFAELAHAASPPPSDLPQLRRRLAQSRSCSRVPRRQCRRRRRRRRCINHYPAREVACAASVEPVVLGVGLLLGGAFLCVVSAVLRCAVRRAALARGPKSWPREPPNARRRKRRTGHERLGAEGDEGVEQTAPRARTSDDVEAVARTAARKVVADLSAPD